MISKPPSSSSSEPQSILEKLKSFYHKDEFSYNVEEWNQQRAQIIEDMYLKFLSPEFEKELRSKLLHEAKQYVFREGHKMLTILEQAPLRANDNEDHVKSGHVDYNEHDLNVLSITFTTSELDESGGNSLASVAAASFVNAAGELDEFVRVRNFNLGLNQTSTREFINQQREEKIQDLTQLEEFIIRKEPNVIIINNENKDALIVLDDINYILTSLADKKHTKLGNLKVELVDNELAKLFDASKQSHIELGQNVPVVVRQGICLAKYVQDPLLCYSQLCNLMATLSQDKQLKTYPVATNILFLVTKCTLGRRVFINCAGYIKFEYDTISKEIDEDDFKESQSSQMDEAKYIEILDSTRVHPET